MHVQVRKLVKELDAPGVDKHVLLDHNAVLTQPEQLSTTASLLLQLMDKERKPHLGEKVYLNGKYCCLEPEVPPDGIQGAQEVILRCCVWLATSGV